MNQSIDQSTSQPMSQPIDQAARQRALDPQASFAVSAPAGSGKTGLLTQRVLTLLANCEQPEEVLSITFTRKAAAEMQTRIYDALHTAANQPCPSDAYAAHTWQLAQKVLAKSERKNWQLLQNKNRLRVMTIDGLCRTLTQQLPISSGLGVNLDTSQDPSLLYQEACRSLLDQLETESPHQEAVRHLFQHLDNNYNKIEALLTQLLANRDQWLTHIYASRDEKQYLESVLENVVNNTLSNCAFQLQPVASDIALLADYAANNLRQENQTTLLAECLGLSALPAPSASELGQWQGLVQLLITNAGGWRKTVTKKAGFPTGTTKEEKAVAKHRKQALYDVIAWCTEQPGLLEQLNSISLLPKPSYSDHQWAFLDSLTQVLPLLVAQLKLVFTQRKQVDFTEITQAALLALGDTDQPSELALKLDYRIQHILVDEFQDTSVAQLRLLEKLTAGWQPNDGRTLFLVGDGMQSCYSFRGANVGIFLEARQKGIGTVNLEPLDLTVNFRSNSNIVNWVNDTFAQAFPPLHDINRGAVSYARSHAFNVQKEPTSGGVFCHALVDTDNRLDEANLVAKLVTDAQAESPEDSIAILVRSRPHLREILRALEKADLSWQAQEIDPLAKRMAIIDLLSLTRALLDPSDRIAWLALLRSPYCGLNNEELFNFVHWKPYTTTSTESENTSAKPAAILTLIQAYLQPNNDQQNTLDISSAGKKALDRFSRAIVSCWAQRQRTSLRTTIQGLWFALGGPATLLDDSDVDNCTRFFNLLSEHEAGSVISDWEAFLRAVDKLYAAPNSQANPKLQVMTIHKSKGLEFDRVIIPGLETQPRADDSQLILWQERLDDLGNTDLLLAPAHATGDEKDPIYQFVANEMRLKREYEATRLLYVGCTRAIRHLHLIASLKHNAKEEIGSPPKNSLLAPIWPSYKEQYKTTVGSDAGLLPPSKVNLTGKESDQISGHSSETAKAEDWLRRLPENWQLPPFPSTDILANYRGHEFDDDENIPEPETRAAFVARHTGTVLHRQLQHIVENGWEDFQQHAQGYWESFWALQLAQAGLNNTEQLSASKRVRLAIESAFADPVGRWLLDNQHQDSQCEVALWSTNHNGKAALRIIDRTFIAQPPPEITAKSRLLSEKGEYRWIIDYKSSEPGEVSETEFLKEQIELYSPQLRNYAALYRKRGEKEIRTALYFPLIGCFQEIDWQN